MIFKTEGYSKLDKWNKYKTDTVPANGWLHVAWPSAMRHLKGISVKFPAFKMAAQKYCDIAPRQTLTWKELRAKETTQPR